MTRLGLTLALLVLLAGCPYPEQIDYGAVCVSAKQNGDQHVLVVDASSGDCASDHKGASFECTITSDGSTAHIETVFRDGKDPNDACAPPLETTCEVAVEPGTHTLVFADEQHEFEVPSNSRICFPGGFDHSTEG